MPRFPVLTIIITILCFTVFVGSLVFYWLQSPFDRVERAQWCQEQMIAGRKQDFKYQVLSFFHSMNSNSDYASVEFRRMEQSLIADGTYCARDIPMPADFAEEKDCYQIWRPLMKHIQPSSSLCLFTSGRFSEPPPKPKILHLVGRPDEVASAEKFVQELFQKIRHP